VHMHGVAHGVAKELPTNTLLTPGNYYAVVFEYVDVDVNIFGADPTLGVDYYPNGYAFTVPDTVTPIVAVGVNQDCMFKLLTVQDTWVERVTVTENGTNEAHVLVQLEDLGMKSRVLGLGDAQDSMVFDQGKQPAYLPAGGKLEVYYADVFTSTTTKVAVTVDHWASKFDAYVVDP